MWHHQSGTLCIWPHPKKCTCTHDISEVNDLKIQCTHRVHEVETVTDQWNTLPVILHAATQNE